MHRLKGRNSKTSISPLHYYNEIDVCREHSKSKSRNTFLLSLRNITMVIVFAVLLYARISKGYTQHIQWTAKLEEHKELYDSYMNEYLTVYRNLTLSNPDLDLLFPLYTDTVNLNLQSRRKLLANMFDHSSPFCAGIDLQFQSSVNNTFPSVELSGSAYRYISGPSGTWAIVELSSAVCNVGYSFFGFYAIWAALNADPMVKLIAAFLFVEGVASALYHSTFWYGFGVIDGLPIFFLTILLMLITWDDIILMKCRPRQNVNTEMAPDSKHCACKNCSGVFLSAVWFAVVACFIIFVVMQGTLDDSIVDSTYDQLSPVLVLFIAGAYIIIADWADCCRIEPTEFNCAKHVGPYKCCGRMYFKNSQYCKNEQKCLHKKCWKPICGSGCCAPCTRSAHCGVLHLFGPTPRCNLRILLILAALFMSVAFLFQRVDNPSDSTFGPCNAPRGLGHSIWHLFSAFACTCALQFASFLRADVFGFKPSFHWFGSDNSQRYTRFWYCIPYRGCLSIFTYIIPFTWWSSFTLLDAYEIAVDHNDLGLLKDKTDPGLYPYAVRQVVDKVGRKRLFNIFLYIKAKKIRKLTFFESIEELGKQDSEEKRGNESDQAKPISDPGARVIEESSRPAAEAAEHVERADSPPSPTTIQVQDSRTPPSPPRNAPSRPGPQVPAVQPTLGRRVLDFFDCPTDRATVQGIDAAAQLTLLDSNEIRHDNDIEADEDGVFELPVYRRELFRSTREL